VGDLSATLALTAPNLVAIPVLQCGTEEQKKEILPHFCTESFVYGSAALMEPRFDFDPNAMKTTATKKRREIYSVGHQMQCAFCRRIRMGSCIRRLRWAMPGIPAAQRHRPAWWSKELERNMGMRAFPMYAVELRNAKWPHPGALGRAGHDYQLLLNSITHGVIGDGGRRRSRGLRIRPRLRQKPKAFGEMIAQRQSIAFTLSDMITDIEALA